MARRKNSAEMLDVLRRITQEDKARRLKQLQKTSPPLQPAAEIFRVFSKKADSPGEQQRAAEQPGAGEGPVDPMAMAAASTQSASPSISPAPGGPLSPGGSARSLFAGPPLRTEGQAEPPNRLRRSFLSVLAGGRTRVPVLAEAPAMAASLVKAAPETAQETASPEAATVHAAGGDAPELEARLSGEGPDSFARTPVESPAVSAARFSNSDSKPARAAGTGSFARGGAGEEGAGGAGLGAGAEPERGDEAGHIQARSGGGPQEGSGFAFPRKPLFSVPADEGGLRGLWSRFTNVLVGEGLVRGVKETLESRIGSIALYVAVALAALLVVILYTNNPGDENPEAEKLLQSLAPGPDSAAAPQPPIELELVPAGQNVPPEVRNIERSGSDSAPKATQQAQGTGPSADPSQKAGVWKGETGPRGHYIQVQSAVLTEHTEAIVSYLGELGYRSIWLRPMRKIVVDGGKAIETFIIRLGPFESSKVAEDEKKNYLQLTKEKPFRSKPRINLRDPFVLPHQPR